MIRPFFRMTPEEIAGVLHSDLINGLDDKNAAARMRKYGRNRIWHITRESFAGCVSKIFFDPASVLLILIAVIAAVFGKREQILAMCVILILGAFMRMAVYLRARRVFEEKAKCALPHCRVLRDGRVVLLPAEAIVEGDVVLISQGDTVCADCRVISSGELVVSELGVTENRYPVAKTADVLSVPEDSATEIRSNMLYAGSVVVMGTARAIVVGTGEESYVRVKHGYIEVPTGEDMPVLTKIGSWCRFGSLVMLSATVIITFLGMLLGKYNEVIEVFISAMSLAAASMSEFFNYIALIIIAASMDRVSEGDGSIIKNPASVGRIAAVDTVVINSPKILKSGRGSVHSYFIDGRVYRADELGDDPELRRMADELVYFAYCSGGSTPDQLASAEQEGEGSGDSRYRILRESGADFGAFKYSPIEYMPCTDRESGGADNILLFDGERAVIASAGDINTVLPFCSDYMSRRGRTRITPEIRNALAAEYSMLTRTSATVIAVAKRLSPYNTLHRIRALQMNMCFLGYVAISEAAASGTSAAISRLREAGFGIVMLSDGGEPDAMFARDIGIIDGDADILSPSAREPFSFTYQAGKCAAVTVPDPSCGDGIRREVIRAIRASGCRPLLCGVGLADGDIIKSSTAVVSVTEADRRHGGGSLVTQTAAIPYAIRAASDLLIMTPGANGGFREAIGALEDCRGAFAKLNRAASYLISAQLARLILAVIGVMPGMYLPNGASLLLWGTVFDFAAVLAAAMMPPDRDILSMPRSKLSLPSRGEGILFPAAMGVLWAILLASMPAFATAIEDSVPVTAMKTLIFASSAFSLNAVALSSLRGNSVFRGGFRINAVTVLTCIGTVGTGLLALFSRGFSDFLGMSTAPGGYLILPIVSAAVMLAAYEIYKRINR